MKAKNVAKRLKARRKDYDLIPDSKKASGGYRRPGSNKK